MSRTPRRLTDDERKRFVIAETVCAGVTIALGLTATAALHTPVFGAVLLLFAGMALGHALAITLGFAHPPGDYQHPRRRP
jgi:hypothetical protein